jgi:hypothetical protein
MRQSITRTLLWRPLAAFLLGLTLAGLIHAAWPGL